MAILVDLARGMGREVVSSGIATEATPATLRQAYTGAHALDATSVLCMKYQCARSARTVVVPAHISCIVRQLMGAAVPSAAAGEDNESDSAPPPPTIRCESTHLMDPPGHQACLGHSYAWMMQHDLPERRKDTYIAHGPNPFISTAVHHRGLVYNKDTRIALDNWRVGFIIGPFRSPHLAARCCREWVDHTRGKKSKTTRGIYLAQRYKVQFYWDKIKPRGGILPYLRDNGPAAMKSIIADYLADPTSSEETYDSDGINADDDR